MQARTTFALMHRVAIWSVIGVSCIFVGYLTGMKVDGSRAPRWLLPWSDWLGFVVAPFVPIVLGGIVAFFRGRYAGEAHWAGVGTIIGILSAPVGFFVSAVLANLVRELPLPNWQPTRSVELAMIALCVLATAAVLGASVGAAAAEGHFAESQSTTVPTGAENTDGDVRNQA